MQSLSIPRTKLHPPTLRQPIVARPRLANSFRDGRPLIVVAAPAGSGKTTLALEWLAAGNCKVAWLSLDADDNDPVRFIHGVLSALQIAGLNVRPASGGRNLKTIVSGLINHLLEADPIVLVLDDYHVIQQESIHEAVTYLLDHIPPALQLVLVTRESPPLPLARLRARGQLQEFGLADLRFTIEETGQFLDQVMGLDLSQEQVRSLERYTRGWIAGLQMAGISLQADKGQTVMDRRGQQFIAEYLLNEILMQQPKDVQNFLLATSILDRFSLPLCRAVISRDSNRLLARIQKANLFITTVGAWYQYHPLFRDFLFSQLQASSPERIEDLHRRCMTWLEGNGFPEEAIPHAHAISDSETQARLVGSLAPAYLKRGELVTLRRWLEQLPDDVIWNHPRLCLTQIWLLLDSNLQIDAQSYFDRLGDFLETSLGSEFYAVRALHAAMTHKPDLAMKYAKRAQRSSQAKDPFIQTYVTFGMGAAQKMGLSFFQAEQSFRDSLSLADADGNSYIAIASLVNLADVLFLQARLHDAENCCQEALARFGNSPDAGHWHWTLARIAFEHNKLDAALLHVDRAIELGAEAQENTIHSRGLLQRALIHHAAGRHRLAQADLVSADGIARRLQDRVILRAIIRQRVLFAVEDGDPASARQWLKTLLQDGDGPFPFYQSYATGRLLLAEGKWKRAEGEFESALQSLQDADFVLVRIEVMVWQAVCLARLGRITEGSKVLKQVMKAAQTENVIRPFIEARLGLSKLIERSDGDGFGWVSEAVQANGSRAEGPALTRREREILQLLAVGLSNTEMAERLVIAEGTLKRHIANLYQKLGVHNRAQAILHFHQG